MANKKKILIQLADEDTEFFRKLLDRDDIEFVSGDSDPKFTLIEQEFLEEIQNAKTELIKERDKIAHELAMPLASVKGYAEVILSGMAGELTEQQEKFLHFIKSSAHEMQWMIANLRDSVQLTDPLTVDEAPFQVMPMVTEAIRPFEHMLADKEQTIATFIPDNLPLALGDETRFIQVLTNLVSNAHKYTPDKGKIEITATHTENFIQISVIVTGIGISEADVDKIFVESYYRSDHPTVKKQSGLGLAMILCKHFVERMGGKIWVKSKLYKGSSFHFTIPIAKEDASDD